ncbi:hypothetical protein HKD37_09G025583 [Glycine soja]
MEVHMTAGGVDPPRPPSHDSNRKGTTAKKKLYVIRLLPPRDSMTSSTLSLSSVSIPVRPPDVLDPSSSHVNAPKPSLVPASTPSPSFVDARGPSPVAAKAVTLSIRQQFGQPWPTWGAIPKEHQELFFQRFKLEELGRSVYVDEVFQQTHLRKDTEEFEARLSQARSDAASSVGKSQLTPLDPAEEQRLRSRCWVTA